MGIDSYMYVGLVLHYKEPDIVETCERLLCSNEKCNKSKGNSSFKPYEKFCSTCGSKIIKKIIEKPSQFNPNLYKDYKYEDLFVIPEYIKENVLLLSDYSLIDDEVRGDNFLVEITDDKIKKLFSDIKKDELINEFISDFKNDYPNNDISLKFVTLNYHM